MKKTFMSITTMSLLTVAAVLSYTGWNSCIGNSHTGVVPYMAMVLATAN